MQPQESHRSRAGHTGKSSDAVSERPRWLRVFTVALGEARGQVGETVWSTGLMISVGSLVQDWQNDPGYETPREQMVEAWSWLASSDVNDDPFSTCFRKYPTLGIAVPFCPARPRCQSFRKQKAKPYMTNTQGHAS